MGRTMCDGLEEILVNIREDADTEIGISLSLDRDGHV